MPIDIRIPDQSIMIGLLSLSTRYVSELSFSKLVFPLKLNSYPPEIENIIFRNGNLQIIPGSTLVPNALNLSRSFEADEEPFMRVLKFKFKEDNPPPILT